jgi:hypothetical protein
VHVIFLIATSHPAHLQRPAPMAAEDSRIPLAIRQFLSPCVLAVLALALAVSGWSYGYKLSQYLHHPEVSKASATRMWVDHRNDSLAPVHHPSPPQQIPGSVLVALSSPLLPRISRDHALVTPAPPRPAFIIAALIPFRAPPCLHSSLA